MADFDNDPDIAAFGAAPAAPTNPGTKQSGAANANAGQPPAPIRSFNPGAIMGPDGKIKQFGSMQEGVDAADQLLQRYGSKGINTVSDVVSRWSPASAGNPTSAYIKNVASALNVKPGQQIDLTDPNTRAKLRAAIFRQESGAQWAANVPTTTTQEAAAKQYEADPDIQAFTPGNAPPTQLQQEAAQPGWAKTLLTDYTNARQAANQFGQTVAGDVDTAINGMTGVLGVPTYAAARAIGKTPEQANAASNAVTGFFHNPIGKAAGITNAPAYQQSWGQEAGPTIANSQIGQFIAQNWNKGANWISQQTGMPVGDVNNIAQSLSLAAGPVAGKVGQTDMNAVGRAGEAAETSMQGMANTFSRWKNEIPQPDQEGMAAGGMGAAPSTGTATGAETEGAAPRPGTATGAETEGTATNAQGGTQAPMAKPRVSYAEFKQQLDQQRSGLPPEPGAYNPTPQQGAEPGDVAKNVGLLKKVGINDIRLSAVENDPKQAASQYLTAKASNEPYGVGMTDQINHEKEALDNHFANIESNSGGRSIRYGTPEQVGDQINAGQKIKNGLQAGYDNWVKEGENLYVKADKDMAGVPVQLHSTNDVLTNTANFAYDAERSLHSGVTAYLKNKGLLDDNGNLQPMSVKDAEGLRQYINSKYNPASYGVARQLKSAIDTDVFSQAGPDTYQAARQHWQAGKEVYENPKSVGDLLSDNGVNQKIADEQVMDKVAGFNQSQFNHIVNTLSNDDQTDALNQIKTSLVQKIRQAGQSAPNEPWNAAAASKVASDLSQKLRTAFVDDPDGLQKVYDGIRAGNLIGINTRYPGAAVQAELLHRKFAELAIHRGGGALGATMGTAIGTGIGGPIGGAVGAAGGAAAGENIAGRITNKLVGNRQIKQLQSEIVPANSLNSIANYGKK